MLSTLTIATVKELKCKNNTDTKNKQTAIYKSTIYCTFLLNSFIIYYVTTTSVRHYESYLRLLVNITFKLVKLKKTFSINLYIVSSLDANVTIKSR